MTKIRVKTESRKNIWEITDKELLKSWIKEKNFKTIHSFQQSGPITFGCDCSVDSVFSAIDNATRVAVLTDSHANIGHSLSVVINGTLTAYDIGMITMDDIEEAQQ